MKEKSVADKINESLSAQINSEENSDDDQLDNLARVVDFDHDEYEVPKQSSRSSDFRKKNIKLLSEQSNRYKGKIVSRKDLNIEDDISKMYENSSSEEEESDSNKMSSSEFVDGSNESEMDSQFEIKDESEIENSSDGRDFSDENDDSDDDISLEGEDDANKDAVVESKRQEAEIQKGVCVQNQLRIWERLLELRIRTQKLLNKSNQLPSPIDPSDYASGIAKETTERTCLLLKNLLELKSTLTSQFSELRTHMKRPLQENSALDKYESGEPPLKRVAVQLDDLHNHMRSYRNTVLLKWDDRTKLLTPGAGTKKKINEDFDVVRKIENALLNRYVLIRKSRILQISEINAADYSTKEQAENEETQKEDPNVYEDSDFYHQQLRELIEYKSNSSSNVAEVTKQIVELHKLRQKMKKKVDTRASKGRKIRYIVHNKLVNFMAPDDTTSVHWPDESKDELYKSLFAT